MQLPVLVPKVGHDEALGLLVGGELEGRLGGNFEDIDAVAPPETLHAPLFEHVGKTVAEALELWGAMYLKEKNCQEKTQKDEFSESPRNEDRKEIIERDTIKWKLIIINNNERALIKNCLQLNGKQQLMAIERKNPQLIPLTSYFVVKINQLLINMAF